MYIRQQCLWKQALLSVERFRVFCFYYTFFSWQFPTSCTLSQSPKQRRLLTGYCMCSHFREACHLTLSWHDMNAVLEKHRETNKRVAFCLDSQRPAGHSKEGCIRKPKSHWTPPDILQWSSQAKTVSRHICKVLKAELNFRLGSRNFLCWTFQEIKIYKTISSVVPSFLV